MKITGNHITIDSDGPLSVERQIALVEELLRNRVEHDLITFRASTLSRGIDPDEVDGAVEVYREMADASLAEQLAVIRARIAAVDPWAFQAGSIDGASVQH